MPHAAVGALDIYHEVHGEGPPLVLVMGLGVSHDAWLPLLPLFGAHRTLILDNAGVGRTRLRATGAPPEPPYAIPSLADDLAGLLRELSFGPAHVCGVSMGGAIAMELAVRAPELVRSLVLCSTWPRTDGWLRRIFAFREDLLAQAGEQALQLYVSLWAWASGYWEGDGVAVSSTEQLISQADTDVWTAAERGAYLGHLHASIAHDCEDRLGGVTAPTLVVVGDEDVLTPLRFARRMVDRIPDARLEVVPGAGHAFSFEDPERFASLVTGFAAEH